MADHPHPAHQAHAGIAIALICVALLGGIGWALLDGVAAAFAYEGAGLILVAGMGWLAWKRPTPRWPWLCLAGGLLISVAGDASWDVAELVASGSGTTSWVANGLYLAAYPVFLIGVLGLLGHKVRERDGLILLDGAVSAIATWLVVWALVIAPQIEASGAPLVDWLPALAFPPLDVMIIIVVWRLAQDTFGRGRRIGAWTAMAAWIGLTGAVDVAYAIGGMVDTGAVATLLEAGWLLGYGLLAASCALRVPERPEAVPGSQAVDHRRLRIFGLATALMIPSLLVGLHPDVIASMPGMFAVSGGALVLAVIARLAVGDARQRKAETELAWGATHDGLTGLANRHALHEALARAIARSRRSGKSCAVLFIDLDEFKVINDSLGHSIGDLLLVEVASRIRAAVRDIDLVARLGGDEFVVVCEDLVSDGEAELVAGRILAGIEEDVQVSGRDLRVGASIGLVLRAEQYEDATVLLRNADLAMYQAKSGGRGVVAHYDPSMPVRMADRLETETALRHAMLNGELRLDYQPIVDLETKEIVAYEALVRWERDGYGLVGPAGFVPIAEASGLIDELGAWVMRNALQQWNVWRDEGLIAEDMQLALNVSSRQLRIPDAAQRMLDILTVEGVSTDIVRLEITESALLEPTDAVSANVGRLRQAGLAFAIDDFGTGYSSVAALKKLAVHCIKIDRSFVADLGRDEDAGTFVRSIISLAHALGMVCTAEGVERPEQLALLEEMGCDRAQGFLIGRPAAMPLAPMVLDASASVAGAHRAGRDLDRGTNGRSGT